MRPSSNGRATAMRRSNEFASFSILLQWLGRYGTFQRWQAYWGDVMGEYAGALFYYGGEILILTILQKQYRISFRNQVSYKANKYFICEKATIIYIDSSEMTKYTFIITEYSAYFLYLIFISTYLLILRIYLYHLPCASQYSSSYFLNLLSKA